MPARGNHDFAMERLLREKDPVLHKRFSSAVFAVQHILSNFKLLFPEYTDHSSLHSMKVIDLCNELIGDQIAKMNADEIYVLLTGCYFHDTGMGITKKDYRDFSKEIDFGNYFDTHDRDDYAAIIRSFHNEFSACFIRKYADLFDIPSGEHEWAIVQVARGHRKTDLLDEREYPVAYPMPNGNTVCLPYIAALIRLADEMDAAADRNPILLYDLEALTDDLSVVENTRLHDVKSMDITRDAFVLNTTPSSDEIRASMDRMVEKMRETLTLCRKAVVGRTPFSITQSRIEVREI